MSSDGFSLEAASAQHFQPLVGTAFGVRPEVDAMDVGSIELKSVTSSPEVVNPLRNPFSLFFVGPASLPLGQGTYFLNHPALGTFPLFIVPIAGDAEQRQYQAVFN